MLRQVKEIPSESFERCVDGKERTGSCAGTGVASVQRRTGGRKGVGSAVFEADGGRVADGS